MRYFIAMWWIGFHSFLDKARVYVNAFEYFNTICMCGATDSDTNDY